MAEERKQATPEDRQRQGRSKSMHEGIAVWCDCCSCEAEERWVEVGEKMGIDFNDYEDGRHRP